MASINIADKVIEDHRKKAAKKLLDFKKTAKEAPAKNNKPPVDKKSPTDKKPSTDKKTTTKKAKKIL